MSGRRLDVTATQAIASMLATLTGAVAASGLGIAGTIIGAAFMSLAGTVGGAVYQHYLARSNERLRSAAANLAPVASRHAVTMAIARHHEAGESGTAGPATADRQAEAPRGPDWDQTDELPALAGDGCGPDGAGHSQPDGAGHGQPDGAGDGQPGAPEHGQPGDGQPGGAGHSRRRRWLMLAAVALGTFVIAMAGITAFEVIAGKPLETVVWHRAGHGTTVGGFVSGDSGDRGSRPASTPSPSSSPTGGRSSSASTTPSTSTSAAPSPTASGSGSSSPAPSASSSGSSPPAGTSASPSPTVSVQHGQ